MGGGEQVNISHNVLLRFHSNTQEVVRLTVPRARLTLNAVEAAEAMQAIIAGGIVITGNGVPVEIKGAEIVTTETAPIV